MLDTLRSRFILSHTLPLLVIVPLMGIALIYILETQVLLVNLAAETKSQALILGQLANEYPDLWTNPATAQAFVRQAQTGSTARVMLVDAQGRLLASGNSSDDQRGSNLLTVAGMSEALAGRESVQTNYSQRLDAEIVDVFVPVRGSNQQVIGVIRLTHPLGGVYAQFSRLRLFIAGILGVALVLGAGVGLVLALNLERPLRQLTQAVYHLASGEPKEPLPEQGPAEMRVLLRAFNTVVERLHGLEETRRQLLSNLVHELGTPLGALNSGILALQRGAVEQAALRQELLAGMADEVQHLRRLLDDLAQLYDQLVGNVNLNPQPVALGEWLPRLLTTWQQAAQAKGLKWQTQLADDLPTLQADPDRLAQILGNLISNAIKYTRAGGSVSVTARCEDSQVCLCVSDTGVGIPADEQVRVFQPFYRGRAGGRFAEGMGLGLTIAQDLARAHGGRLEMDSTPGKGSRFTLWLPI
jgi:signal transduction histidine kinase